MKRFYPHAPGGARRAMFEDVEPVSEVSIRTPRAGRDRAHTGTAKAFKSFYPHAPGGARLFCL